MLSLAALILSLSSCTLYHSGKEEIVEKDGVHYLLSGYFKVCFVTYITIPEGQTSLEITIPDRLDSGHKVEGIGGYVGTGVPAPCDIIIEGFKTEGIYDHEEYEAMIVADRFTDYSLTVNVGKNINDILFYYPIINSGEPYVYYTKLQADDSDGQDAPQYIRVRVYINIDDDNMYYYSENGVVYTKEQNTNQ